jgi:hypothetical protein
VGRFVKPEVVTLPLSQGDSLTVRKRLNYGEQSAAFDRMYLAGADGKARVNPLRVGIETVLAYLLDWTLTDDGKPVVVKGKPREEVEAVLRNLEPETFGEIRAAVDAHIEAQAAEREQEKARPFGTTEPLAT